jgi:repressor LexA
MKGLTRKQRQIIAFIEGFTVENGYPPTVSEVAKHFDIAGPTAFQHIRALREKGYLERSSKARSLMIKRSASVPHFSLSLSVPLLGRISAGAPLLSEEHVEGHVGFPKEHMPSNCLEDELFALRVFGESMRDLGIMDGDVVIAHQSDSASNGDIAVALVEGSETTVKSFYKHKDKIELRPANEEYEPQFYPFEEVNVQGVVIALQRIF